MNDTELKLNWPYKRALITLCLLRTCSKDIDYSIRNVFNILCYDFFHLCSCFHLYVSEIIRGAQQLVLSIEEIVLFIRIGGMSPQTFEIGIGRSFLYIHCCNAVVKHFQIMPSALQNVLFFNDRFRIHSKQFSSIKMWTVPNDIMSQILAKENNQKRLFAAWFCTSV